MALGRTNINLPEIPTPRVIIEDEFQGTTLNTDLWTWRSDYTATCTVNNGITISNGSDASNTKVNYLQLNRRFTGKEKRITASFTVTNITGSYKEARFGFFAGQEPSGLSGESSGLYDLCGLIIMTSTYNNNHFSIYNASNLVSSGSVPWNIKEVGARISFPMVLRAEIDLMEETFAIYQGGTLLHSGTLPSNMEQAIGKPFLFITTQMFYALSVTLANVSVVIE